MIRNYAHKKTVKLVLAGLLCASIAQNSFCSFGILGKIRSIFSKAPKQTTKSSFLKEGCKKLLGLALIIGGFYALYKLFKNAKHNKSQYDYPDLRPAPNPTGGKMILQPFFTENKLEDSSPSSRW